MNFIHSTLDKVREWAPVNHTSTFRQNGQITPEEFVAAGDYLVYKFPTWSWADASPVSKRATYLPAGKQFLVTRGVPCHRRLDDNFAGDAGHDETVVGDGDDFKVGGGTHSPGDDEDGWLRTGGLAASQEARARDVRTVDDSGNMGEREDDEDEIPDMEDEDEDGEAIIPEPKTDSYDASIFIYLDHLLTTLLQIAPDVHPLHCIHTLLSYTTAISIWLPCKLATTSPAADDGRYRWRL